MSIAEEFLRCLAMSVETEVHDLLKFRVLDSCDADWARWHGRAAVLKSILKEHTLTYLGLRKLYQSVAPSRGVTFEAECKCERGTGRIDLVLTDGGEEYAIEIKRWEEKEDEILGNDLTKLKYFSKGNPHRHGYSLVFTVNADEDIGDRFRRDKQGYYIDHEFNPKLGSKYDLCETKVLEFETFTVCLYLASPKPEALTD
jgi:hypothetical protein